MQYRLLGIDLDGTLLDRRGRVSERNAAALRAAHEAGTYIVPCTGRGWREAHHVLAPLSELELGVFVTGASISRIETGHAVDFSVIESHLAWEMVQALFDEPEAVLVYREASLAGHDYLVTGRGELSHATEWWFQYTGATVHFQRDVGPDDLHHTLRVGLVVTEPRLEPVHEKITARFGDRVQLHHFEAQVNTSPGEAIHVLEIFGQGVDKWRGLKWIADEQGIDTHQIAAIGDEINDLSMLAAAGCGIAMGNAIDAAKDCARHVTAPNTENGVAQAIERMLSGQW